jgi:hypothetical protein
MGDRLRDCTSWTLSVTRYVRHVPPSPKREGWMARTVMKAMAENCLIQAARWLGPAVISGPIMATASTGRWRSISPKNCRIRLASAEKPEP